MISSLKIKNCMKPMNNEFTPEICEVFRLMSDNNLMEALNYIHKQEKGKRLDSNMAILKTYIQIEMQDYIAAEGSVDKAKDGKIKELLKRIYLALNRIGEFVNLCKSEHQEIYEAAVLLDDWNTAKKKGMALFSKNPFFLLFALINTVRNENNQNDISILKLTLEKCDYAPCIFILLIDLGILVDYVVEKTVKIKHKDINYLYLVKKIFMLKEYRQAALRILGYVNDESKVFNLLIDHFDDWDIYEEAMERKIEITKRKTMNYQIYEVFLGRMEVNPFFKNLTDFEMISKISGFVGRPSGLENMDILLDLESNGFSDELLRKSFSLYQKENCLFNLKILIALFIASKKESNLVAALYLAKKEMSTYDTYEIQLIYLFLCRFFCLLDEIMEMFSTLQIKSIQHETLSFICNDVSIVTGKNNKKYACKALNFNKSHIRNCNEFVGRFIKSGKLDYASNLLCTRKKLMESKISEELSSGRIMAANPENEFSYILGKHCCFVFDKIVVNGSKNLFEVCNIYGYDEKKSKISCFLKNDFFEYEADFVDWIKSIN